VMCLHRGDSRRVRFARCDEQVVHRNLRFRTSPTLSLSLRLAT
jgi:hypothetical protein